ncbi:MAG TPA: hypothetical protein VHC39_13100 [Rhizomicrobium sp.]|nr:hypothetical protein [Rhizomicrobium sp.]
MDGRQIVDAYLARAKEAEDQAARSTDLTMKESWLNIASSYRQMAQAWLDRMAAPKQPSRESAKPTKTDDEE